jgi:uncharacterized Zn finger protein (UPF0148 family)
MPLPCPSCTTPLDLTLEFILKNPVSVCPHCQTVLNFNVDKSIQKEYNQALQNIEDVKKKYSKIAKFK